MTWKPGVEGGNRGNFSLPSLTATISEIEQNSLKCVGDPGGVTMSQSRSSFFGFVGTLDRRVFIVGFAGEGLSTRFFLANGSLARSFSEAIHEGANMESPLFGITPLPPRTPVTSCNERFELRKGKG